MKRFFLGALAAIAATAVLHPNSPDDEYARRCLPWQTNAGVILAAEPDDKDQAAEAKDEEDRDFQPRTVINRHFKPIVDAPFVAAEKAGEIVRDHDLVLGVEVNGEARAYPINLLCGPQREIINDRLGGQAIAATW